MVSRKDEEGRILVVEEEKKKAKKIHDRTYDIIMSEKPQRHFHFRYVVYTAGILIGVKMLYHHNESFRHWCQKVAISYKCGRLRDDFKNFCYNFLFAENATVKVWLSSLGAQAASLLRGMSNVGLLKQCSRLLQATRHLSYMCAFLVSCTLRPQRAQIPFLNAQELQ